MPARKSSLGSRIRRIADTASRKTLRDVGVGVQHLIYRATRDMALRETAKLVGAKAATIEAIAEQKVYSDIGGTEIASYLNSEFTNQPKQNLQILASLYETHPWVKVCTSWIAGALSGIPVRVWRATGFEDGKEVLEPADDSPAGMMFRWINPQQSPSEFTEELASWLLLTGEAYVAFSPPMPGSPSGVPAEMYVLFSPFVEKVVSPNSGLVGYEYNVGGEIAYFDVRDVAYLSTFSPAGRFRGQGTATAGMKTIQTDMELREFNKRVLQQGVHLSGILETDNEDLNKESATAMRKSFEHHYSGSKKAARIAVLWGGMRFSPQTILQKDVMMSEQIAANRDEIIALYGLKPELLTEKFANKATAETVRRMAYEDTVLGRWGKRIESVFSHTALSRFDPNLRLRFDARDVPALQTSMRERIEVGETAIQSGQMTINEVRESMLHLPPVDGVEGDVLLVGGRPAAGLLTEGDGEPPAKGTTLSKALQIAETSFATLDAKQQEFELAYHRLRSRAEARTEAAIRKVLREIQKEVRTIASRSVTNAEILDAARQVVLFDGRKVMVESVSDSLRAAIDDATKAELIRLTESGLVTTFDVKPVRALHRLGSQEQRIRDMQNRSWSNLRKSLQEGLSEGETTAELRARTSKFFDGARNNAATIARTEVNAAINAATQDVAIAARAAGNDVVSVWVTSQDENVRTRPASDYDHSQAHGLTIIPGEEMFVVSGDRMEYPGDSWNGAAPGNTINCRCGVRNEIRKVRGDDNRGEL